MRRAAMIAVSALALGCNFGQRADHLSVAHQPGGIQTRITERNGTIINAELLAADDTGLVLLWSRQVAYLPYARTATLLSQAISLSIIDGRPPLPDVRGRLRLVSRFPQGLTPDLEARLLAAYHQRAVVMVAQ